jgi:hypothetical protein
MDSIYEVCVGCRLPVFALTVPITVEETVPNTEQLNILAA